MSKELTPEDVYKVFQLARIAADDSDLDSLTGDFNAILEYVNQLENVNVDETEPMSHVHGSTNVFREDKVHHSLDTEEALSNAPSRSGSYIKVPIIVDQGIDN